MSMVFAIKNHGPIRHYLSAVEEGNARITEEHLSQKEQMEEEMFLGLRKKSGVSMARFGGKIWPVFLMNYMAKSSETWFKKVSCK